MTGKARAAYVEAVVPTWVKGCEEPIKISYDCGMGREFAQEELEEEILLRSRSTPRMALAAPGASCAATIAGRAPSSAGTTRHASHGRDHRARLGRLARSGRRIRSRSLCIERQAEIVRAPIFMKLLEEFVEYADQEPENLSDDLTKLAQIARRIISEVSQ